MLKKDIVNQKHLTLSDRIVIENSLEKEMSFKEIAATTNVSINTALGRMRYAILNMRRMARDNNMQLQID